MPPANSSRPRSLDGQRGRRASVPGASPTVARARALIAGTIALVLLGACGGESTAPVTAPDEPTPDLRFGQVIWTDTLDAVVAYSHCDHWHGSIRLRERVNQPLKLWFAPACQVDHSEPPKSAWLSLTGHNEYTVRVELQDPTIALYEGTRDRFMVQPRRVGASPSVIVVRRNGRVVYRDPAFPTSVVP